MRWAQAGHSIVIGSRDAERARAKAAEMCAASETKTITGESNAEAARLGEIVVVALPANGLAATLPETRQGCRGKVVVSTVVPLTFGGPAPLHAAAAGLRRRRKCRRCCRRRAWWPPSTTSRPTSCPPPSTRSSATCSSAAATPTPRRRSRELRALAWACAPIDVGALTNAGPLEGITAVLATINRRYKLKNSGIKITGLS